MSKFSAPVRLALIAFALLSIATLFVFAYFDHALAGLLLGAASSLGSTLRTSYLKGVLFMMLAGFAIVFWLIYRFYARIEAYQRLIRQIVASADLSSRLPAMGDDDFAALTHDLNAVLERTQKLAQGVRHAGDSIAHDLRTPLTRMRTDVEVALQGDDPNAWHETLERILAEVGGMQSIFNSLLSLGQAEAGGMRLKAKEVDMTLLLDEIAELYTPSAEEHEMTLQSDIPPGLKLMGDRQLLAQTFSNLLDNAIKYVPDGGTIRLSVKSHDDKLEIVVEDNGPGIPEDMREKIFERFTRIDPSRTLPGTGLGLALVKAFAELHRGKIDVEQSELGGAAFRITLPLH